MSPDSDSQFSVRGGTSLSNAADRVGELTARLWPQAPPPLKAVWKIASLGLTCTASQAFLREAFEAFGQFFPIRTFRWMQAERGEWKCRAAIGADIEPPLDVLAAVLDSGRAKLQTGWFVVPTGFSNSRSELLAIGWQGIAAPPEAHLEHLTETLLLSWKSVRDLEMARHRMQRLEALLEISGQWNEVRDTESLLNRMAQAATKLFDAERASIFLWDRQAHMLVGRPALGVEGGELRIPDDRGVVGKVIQTGLPRRASSSDAQPDIDRSVDKKLHFRTRSLLCVPLFGKNETLLGAFELLNKRGGEFTEEDQTGLIELAAHASIALQTTQQYEQLLRVRNQLADQAAASVLLIGESPAICELRKTIQRVAETDLAVLILGANGTGKEVVARMVHYLSRRRNESLVAVNCAAMPDTLLESELFGHEKGAFTDARETRIGKFELAAGGTLLLDEIGEMSLAGQAKLLRVLEEKVIVRVGGSLPIRTESRVIAATNQNLAEMVRSKRFREDLFFRLSVVALTLPPLRDRGDDVFLLANHFLEHFSKRANRQPPEFTAAAKKRMLSHDWPGNVRELRNLVERLVYLNPSDKIDASDLLFVLPGKTDQNEAINLNEPLGEATRLFQIDYIKRQIERARGSMTDAAERLGLHRANLYRKMKQLGMDVDES